MLTETFLLLSTKLMDIIIIVKEEILIYVRFLALTNHISFTDKYRVNDRAVLIFPDQPSCKTSPFASFLPFIRHPFIPLLRSRAL